MLPPTLAMNAELTRSCHVGSECVLTAVSCSEAFVTTPSWLARSWQPNWERNSRKWKVRKGRSSSRDQLPAFHRAMASVPPFLDCPHDSNPANRCAALAIKVEELEEYSDKVADGAEVAMTARLRAEMAVELEATVASRVQTLMAERASELSVSKEAELNSSERASDLEAQLDDARFELHEATGKLAQAEAEIARLSAELEAESEAVAAAQRAQAADAAAVADAVRAADAAMKRAELAEKVAAEKAEDAADGASNGSSSLPSTPGGASEDMLRLRAENERLAAALEASRTEVRR